MNCPVPGTVRARAAQPRQVRKEATVSGCMLRLGIPGTGQFILKDLTQRTQSYEELKEEGFFIFQFILGGGKMYA